MGDHRHRQARRQHAEQNHLARGHRLARRNLQRQHRRHRHGRRRQEELDGHRRRAPVGDGAGPGQHRPGVGHHHHGGGAGHDLQGQARSVATVGVPAQPRERPGAPEAQPGQHQQTGHGQKDQVGPGPPANPARAHVGEGPPELQRPPQVGHQDHAAHGDGDEAHHVHRRHSQQRAEAVGEVQAPPGQEDPAAEPHEREPHRVVEVPDPLCAWLQAELVHEGVLGRPSRPGSAHGKPALPLQGELGQDEPGIVGVLAHGRPT